MKKQKYDPSIKDLVMRLHLEENRSAKSLIKEYNLNNYIFYKWLKDYREECQINPETKAQYDNYQEVAELKKQLAELKKENEFLKKAAAFFAKEID